jgi:hypothetical protein
MPFRKNLHRILGLFFAMVLLGAFSLTAFAASSSPAGPQVRQRAFPRKTCAASGTGERAHLLKRFCPARSRANLKRFFAMILAVLLATLFRSGGAQAACSGSGSAGDLMYNADYHVPQYCDGTNWIAMGPRGVGGSGCRAPASGLVGWWKFDETSGTSASDSSGNGNTGTLSASNAAFAAGRINNGLSLTNVNANTSGLVNIANPSNFAFDYNTPFTLAAWIYRTDSTVETDIMGKENPQSSWHGYSLWLDQDSHCAGCLMDSFYSSGMGGVSTVYTNAGTVPNNTWTHVAETYDGSGNASGVTLYINGVSQALSGDTSGTINASLHVTQPFQVGGDGDGDGTADAGCCTFKGKIDDARVYNRALSAGEVTQLYNATSPNYGSGSEGDLIYNNDYHVMQYCDGTNWIAMGPQGAGGGAPSSGLVGWWKFDEGSGTSAADSSGGGNTGTLTPNATGVWVAGKINNAANLNGTSQYVDVANPSNFNFDYSNPFTLAAWIYRTSSADADDEIMAHEDSAFLNGYHVWMPATGSNQAWCGSATCTNCLMVQPANPCNSGLCVIAPNTGAAAGAWHHVAVTYDGSNNSAGIKIYVDGVNQTLVNPNATPCGSMAVTADLLIGSDSTSTTTGLFGGTIDDARVYNRALSAAEVAALYNYTGGSTCSPEGAMIYNSDYNVMEYCNGGWVGIGK